MELISNAMVKEICVEHVLIGFWTSVRLFNLVEMKQDPKNTPPQV